jgi:hypothetical protein
MENENLRYCPYCKKYTPTVLTRAQLVCLLILLGFFIFPGLIYLECRAKKCSICSCPTYNQAPMVEKSATKPTIHTAEKSGNDLDFE